MRTMLLYLKRSRCWANLCRQYSVLQS